jgi:Integrase core domain
VDIKKLGNIPDGGGWRAAGYAQGKRNARATTGQRRNCHPVIGYSYLHTAIDGHSRLACSEILADERKDTAVAFWHRARAWFTAAGITIERVMTGIGSCLSFAWRDALAATGIRHKRIRPYRPGQRGKWSGSAAPCLRSGPAPAPTAQKPNGAPPLTPGCTPTTSPWTHRTRRPPTRQPRPQPLGAEHLAPDGLGVRPAGLAWTEQDSACSRGQPGGGVHRVARLSRASEISSR